MFLIALRLWPKPCANMPEIPNFCWALKASSFQCFKHRPGDRGVALSTFCFETTVVAEHSPCDKKVEGWNPAGMWAFFFSSRGVVAQSVEHLLNVLVWCNSTDNYMLWQKGVGKILRAQFAA